MKLYYSPGACSMSVHIALEELGMKYQSAAVDLKTKKVGDADYLKINPKGSVPALELDNGELLTEASVILQYLADQAPAKNMLPTPGSMERYRAMETLNYISTELHKGFGPLWNPRMPEEAKALAKENLAKKFDWVNEKLTKAKFILGDAPSVADFYLFTILSWANHTKVDLSRWPKITGFIEHMRTRPSVLTTMKAEGLM